MSQPSDLCLVLCLALAAACGSESSSEATPGAIRTTGSHSTSDIALVSARVAGLSQRPCLAPRTCDEETFLSASKVRPLPVRFQDGGGAMQMCSSESARPGERINACTALLLSSATEPHERANLYAQRGVAYYRAGEHDMAIADFTLALELDPALLLALNGRCWIRAIEGVELERARRDCDAAIALDPEFHEALDSRAMVSMREGRWKDAWEDFNAAVSLRGDVAVYLYGRGLASLALEDIEAGNDDLNRARALDRHIDRLYREFGLEPAASTFVMDKGAADMPDN